LRAPFAILVPPLRVRHRTGGAAMPILSCRFCPIIALDHRGVKAEGSGTRRFKLAKTLEKFNLQIMLGVDKEEGTWHQPVSREMGDTTDVHRLMVESVRDYAIFMLDPQGHIATWNAGTQRFKGYTAAEIIGKHFPIFYPKEDVERGKPEMEL